MLPPYISPSGVGCNDLRSLLCLALSGRQTEVQWEQLMPAAWTQLLSMADAEGVIALLYAALCAAGWPSGMSASARNKLTNAFYNTTARNLLLQRELGRVLQAFSNVGISVVVLKGAALAATVYPMPELRPMGDLDLLIRAEDLTQAKIVIQSLGFMPEAQKIGLGMERLVAYEANFDGGQLMPVHVELHWDLVGGERSRYKSRIEWFWRRTESVSVAGVPVQVLDPTANLAYLTAHLTIKHGDQEPRLIWLYDLHLLIRDHADGIDWCDLVGRVAEFSWLSGFQATLENLRTCFGTPVPTEALELAAQHMTHHSPTDRSVLARSRALSMWHRLAGLDFAARLQVLIGLMFPSRAYLRQRYRFRAAWLWPLWYVYRWGDMILDSVLTMARLTFCRKPRH